MARASPCAFAASLISCCGPSPEWSGMILEGALHAGLQIEPPDARLRQWNGRGKGNDLAPI